MEFLFALLILIGVVAAGSNPSTSHDAHTEKHPVSDSEQVDVAQSVHGPCRFPDGRLLQRDLTVPRASISAVSKVHREEAGHGCADR
jgi:hypothetical protein